jgi:hypothetical protein
VFWYVVVLLRARIGPINIVYDIVDGGTIY